MEIMNIYTKLACFGIILGSNGVCLASYLRPPQQQSTIEERDLIIGGNDAPKGRYEYMVSLITNNDHFCGGSLIAPDIVLTAAHCGYLQCSDIQVQIGQYDFKTDDTNTETFRCSKMIKHPGYKNESFRSDFLLLLLDGTSTYTTININTSPSLPSIQDDSLFVMGWGRTNKAVNQNSDKLQEVEVKYISNDECEISEAMVEVIGTQSYEGRIYNDSLCAIETGQDACQGDSGGPIIIKGQNLSIEQDMPQDILVGIVSWGFDCAHPNFPGVYSRVSAEHVWIINAACGLTNATEAAQELLGCLTTKLSTTKPSALSTTKPLALPTITPSTSHTLSITKSVKGVKSSRVQYSDKKKGKGH